MAYSDYVQIYNVRDSAGITASDNLSAQVTKIAAWVNDTFSDIVTAEVYNSSAVKISDKVVNSGICWGSIQSSYTHQRSGFVYSNGSLKFLCTNSYMYENEYPIENLGLFVCKTTDGYVMDFINLSSQMTSLYSGPRFISVNGEDWNGNTKRVCCLFQNYYYSANDNYIRCYTISEGKTTTSVADVALTSYLGSANNMLSRTVLTKFAPLYEDIVCTSLYKIDGSIPQCKTIFELNDSKYLCLNYDSRNIYCGLALKLD